MDNNPCLFEADNAFLEKNEKKETPSDRKPEKEKRLNIARTVYKVFRDDIESITDTETDEIIYKKNEKKVNIKFIYL
jgi:hypothetical protein